MLGFLSVVLLLVLICPNVGYDESIWSYIGWLWNDRGIPPYVGTIENKTPGIFIVFAISDYIAGGSVFFVRFLGAIAVLAASYILYLIAKILKDKFSGALCMYMFGLTMGWYMLEGFSLAQTETFMVFFSVLSFYLILKAKNNQKKIIWILLSGIAIGLAITFKQIALTTLLALYVCLFNFSLKGNPLFEKIKGFVFLSFGVFIAIVLSYVVLYFYQVSMTTYIEEAWIILFDSGSRPADLGLRFSKFCKLFLQSKVILFYPFILLLFVKNKHKTNYLKILIVWFIFDFIGVNASGYYFGHQFKQLLPALTLIISILLSEYINQDKHKWRKIKSANLMAIIVVIIVFAPYEQVLRNVKSIFFDETNTLSTSKEIGEVVKNNTKKDDFIYALGVEDGSMLHCLVESKRMSSSKYFTPIFITSEHVRKHVYSDFLLKPPTLILKDDTADEDLSKIYGLEINNFVKENYSLFNEAHNIKILKHNPIR